MLRAVLHVVLGSSLLAGPASAPPPASADAPGATPGVTGRVYEGVEAVEAPETAEVEAAESPAATPDAEVAPTSPEAAQEATESAPVSPEAGSEAAPEPGASPEAGSDAPERGASPEAAPEAALAPEGPIDDGEDEDVPPYDPLVDSPEAIRARSWVRSGAVFLAIGAVLTGGAIAMSTAKVNRFDAGSDGSMPCDPRKDYAGNGCVYEARQRAVAAMAVPGALLLAGGVAMLVTGKVQQRRLKASLRASRRDVVLGLEVAF
ncbi:MAG TPA: hypothetical protein VIK91_18650 [Nannocystis sp.]